jgi:hypothetical protein
VKRHISQKNVKTDTVVHPDIQVKKRKKGFKDNDVL